MSAMSNIKFYGSTDFWGFKIVKSWGQVWSKPFPDGLYRALKREKNMFGRESTQDKKYAGGSSQSKYLFLNSSLRKAENR